MVGGGVGPGIGRAGVGHHVQGQRLGATERCVGKRHRKFERVFALVAAPTGFFEKLFHIGTRVVAVAVLPIDIACKKIIGVVRGIDPTFFKSQLDSVVRTQGRAEAGACVGFAIFGFHHQSTAQRVEPKNRVGAGHQLQLGHRVGGNQIPVDHRAKGLIHANAIKINRHPHRRTQQRRGLKPSVVHIVLIGITRAIAQTDRAQVVVDQVGQVGDALCLYVLRVNFLHIGRKFIQRDARAPHRQCAHHLDRGQIYRWLGVGSTFLRKTQLRQPPSGRCRQTHENPRILFHSNFGSLQNMLRMVVE